jgi:hypothetical protein
MASNRHITPVTITSLRINERLDFGFSRPTEFSILRITKRFQSININGTYKIKSIPVWLIKY